jgi:hypothetical protein
MLRQLALVLFSVCLFSLAACRASVKVTTPAGEWGAEVDIDISGAQPVPDDAKPLGDATLTLDDGSEVKGKAYDTDGDGVPDKFAPNGGQKGASPGDGGTGRVWYDMDVVS